LVFSQFTSMLDLVDRELEARSIARAWLRGDTIDRETPVKRFQSGEVGVFLISLKAGGVGLNLTRADTVILYDPWWNPAVEAQAIGRAHRIGQDRPVFVHRLIAVGTIEEKMLALQARKRELAAALWSEDATALTALTEDDIRALFA
jgi:SNF2 family DNA or RNA helicase